VVIPERARGWEPIWSDLNALSNYWRAPEQVVVAWGERLRKAGGRRVLDLGCGIGRHTVALARMGFAVTAADVAPSGLVTCAAWLAREGLSATLTCHDMGMIPVPGSFFDGLIAYNVIYHATVAGMRGILSEIRRVLRPNGYFYATIISREDSKVAGYQADIEAGKCLEIEPFTFVYPRDAPDDKYLPHHYSDEAEVHIFLTGFDLDDLFLKRVEYTDESGVVQAGVHYHVQARRL
jgi:SAM-dependent methyltransferase